MARDNTQLEDRNPRTGYSYQKFNYELLTATTLVHAIGAGITAAAGTRLALQLILDEGFRLLSLASEDTKCPPSLFLVSASWNPH